MSEVCSKLTIKNPERSHCHRSNLVAAWKRFHTFFWRFHCWKNKCLLGSSIAETFKELVHSYNLISLKTLSSIYVMDLVQGFFLSKQHYKPETLRCLNYIYNKQKMKFSVKYFFSKCDQIRIEANFKYFLEQKLNS